MLYRGMDRAQLDTAYNNSAAVPNYDAIKADWHARSARVRRTRRGHLDLEYGDTPRQHLDLFIADSRRAPTLTFIHGGYWQRNDKEGFAFLADGPLARGINVAVIGYTLAPDARMDQIVGEIRHAVAWLAEHLGDYGADPARIYVAGHSPAMFRAAARHGYRVLTSGRVGGAKLLAEQYADIVAAFAADAALEAPRASISLRSGVPWQYAIAGSCAAFARLRAVRVTISGAAVKPPPARSRSMFARS